MLYENKHVLSRALRLVDALALSASVFTLRALDVPAGAWEGIPARTLVGYAASLFVAFALVADRLHLYHSRRTATITSEFRALLPATLFALALGCLAVEVAAGGLPGPVHGAVGATGATLLSAMRLTVRASLRRLRRAGKNYRSWLFVGRNRRTAEVVRHIHSKPEYGIRATGILDAEGVDGGAAVESNGFDADLAGVPTLGTLSDLRAVVAEHSIDEVVVTLPLRTFYDEIARVLEVCAEAGVSVKFTPRLFDLPLSKTEVVRLGEIPLVTHYSGPEDHLSLAAKRALDIVGAMAGLLVVSPALLVLGVLVRTTSRGPILFRQTRVGLHGRRFVLYKFRTMGADAEARRAGLQTSNEVDGPVFKIRNDPRVTPVGRWLRRYHLDELPQLWNVLKGDMSLVGPRPPVPEEVARYEWWQRRRLSMPPGLTCLWQVRGRHDISFHRWMELDLEYIDRWTFALDVQVLLRTIPQVLRGGGW